MTTKKDHVRWSFLVETTVLKPRPKKFLSKVYMCSLFLFLRRRPIEQTKQTASDLNCFRTKEREILCSIPKI